MNFQLQESSRNYWDDTAKEFDSIYWEEKTFWKKAVDRFLRKSVRERFNLALEECKGAKGKTILDIGCGSGRLAVELARRGAYVFGIDSSFNMISMAGSLVEKSQLTEKCRLICDGFLEHVFDQKFDISMALGFFDYTKNPVPYLTKMRSLTKEKCMMSFPSRYAFQTPLRIMWLKKRRCPVYFYTKQEITKLLSPFFDAFKIKDISAGYFSVAYASTPTHM